MTLDGSKLRALSPKNSYLQKISKSLKSQYLKISQEQEVEHKAIDTMEHFIS